MDPNELALLSARQGHVAHWLVTISGRHRQTGEIETAGFWTGDDHQQFTVGGVTLTYFGAGAALDVPPIRQEVGLQVQYLTCSLAVTPEVLDAVLGYDPALQPAQVHRAIFDPLTMTLVAEPELVFAGTVDGTPIDDGGIGGSGVVQVQIASKTRTLTRTLTRTKSDATLRARAPADGFRKYVADSATWTVPWNAAPPPKKKKFLGIF